MNRFRRRIIATLSLLVLFAASTSAAIVRRHDVADEEYTVPASDYPAVVDLYFDEPGDCLATLIAPQWLVTAAHCIDDLTTGDVIQVGEGVYGVAAIDVHSGWDEDIHDISLIQLDAEVPDVEPIPWYTGDNEVGQVVWFIGRGDTSTGDVGGGSPDGNTRAATNTVVGADPYWIRFVFNSPDDPEVTPLEGISGDGDSGGPALVETPEGLRVMGLSSYQDEGGRPLGTYGVEEFYTRLSRYADWIEHRVRFGPTAQEGCSCRSASGLGGQAFAAWILLLLGCGL